MIFGAPRVAPEKAVFRPALAMSCLPGTSEMQMSKTYSEKLKDPRWQKKRLEALDAAAWTCAACSDTTTTLHVHHRQYFKGREPWEYEIGQLEVLCADCHTLHHEDVEPDPLMLAVSFVPALGRPDRDSAASLLAGYCGHDMGNSYVGDPGAFIVGQVAQLLEERCFVNELDELRKALKTRDLWTVTAAVHAFVLDLQTRPDAPAQERGML